eukprot:CAMPEP_0198440704 /NCGR_PEP_ID=MMETSP1452-20131203/59789_1 /TAXON_ID=1181717 /ORGANISM="Synchroma pusillum, Strain CCMP3072" /LENGTH=160 /DNA_ID=CAMNT_0044161321 /DNA_START=16 /DNA_END=498 /DNA_ORIENTATION=-
MAGEAPREVDISSFSVEQLNNLKQNFEQEVRDMQTRVQVLAGARRRFANSQACLDELGEASDGDPMLVPVTESMYCAGRVASAGTVLVDIGTGFYMERSLADARQYLQRKVALVDRNMEAAGQVLQQKGHNLDQVTMALQHKILRYQQMEAQQKQQRQAS